MKTKARAPTIDGEVIYYQYDGKLTALVALRRYDTDDLDWFEVGAKPFFTAEDAPSQPKESTPG